MLCYEVIASSVVASQSQIAMSKVCQDYINLVKQVRALILKYLSSE